MSTILPQSTHGVALFRMQVWNVVHAARWKYRTQKSRQKSPSGFQWVGLQWTAPGVNAITQAFDRLGYNSVSDSRVVYKIIRYFKEGTNSFLFGVVSYSVTVHQLQIKVLITV